MSPGKQVLSHRGFSLIELIITLIVAGILGVVVYTLISAQSKNSVQSLLWLKEGSVLVNAMEKLDGYYRSLIESKSLDLDGFKEEINTIVQSVDPNIQFDAQFILFDEETKKEVSDNTGVHRFLKVRLKKNDITLENLFTQ